MALACPVLKPSWGWAELIAAGTSSSSAHLPKGRTLEVVLKQGTLHELRLLLHASLALDGDQLVLPSHGCDNLHKAWSSRDGGMEKGVWPLPVNLSSPLSFESACSFRSSPVPYPAPCVMCVPSSALCLSRRPSSSFQRPIGPSSALRTVQTACLAAAGSS